MFRILLISFLALLSSVWAVSAQPLETLYFERPPYYTTVNGQPDGLLLNRVRDIFTLAGVPHVFQDMPPGRAIETVKADLGPVCAIGWIKTQDRESYATFSLPIYQDEPLCAVFLKSGTMPPPGMSTLAQLVEQTRLSIGVNQAYAYGHTVDSLLARARPHLVRTPGTQKQLLRMLVAQRFDFMLVNPTEIDALAAMANIPANTLHVLRLADLPKGNIRYLMFSKSTPPEVIERINEAIRTLAEHNS